MSKIAAVSAFAALWLCHSLASPGQPKLEAHLKSQDCGCPSHLQRSAKVRSDRARITLNSSIGLLSIPPASPPTTNLVTVVDVMVVYTGAAKTNAESETALHSLIDLAVAEANTVYQNSDINVRLRLVYRGEVDYAEADSNATNLLRLQLKDDGFLDEVHQLRATNRADLVTLVTKHGDPGVGGQAFTMGEPTPFFRDFGFSVVTQSDLVGSFIYVHEISHNFGAQHDRENSFDEEGKIKPGSFPYSFGHRFEAEGILYRDVMAYAPGLPIPYLSNPNVLYKGVPTGVPGTTNGANNALTVNSNAVFVGTFFGNLVRTMPPKITLTSQLPEIIPQSGTNLLLTVQASDGDGAVPRAEFYAENFLLGVETNAVISMTNLVTISTNASGRFTNTMTLTNYAYSLTWSNVPPGIYRLTGRAVDNLGASSAATPVAITIRPFNDSFTNRLALDRLAPMIEGSNRAATSDPGEPNHGGIPGVGSVWYSWQAPKDGTVTATVSGGTAWPVVEIYKSLTSTTLTTISRDFEFDPTNRLSHAKFDASAGESYALAVDTFAPNTGEFSLSLAFVPPPSHDNFTNRIQLSGESVLVQGENTAATKEAGEPLHADNPGGKSVWYSWLAPRSGVVIVTATATNFFPLADVYPEANVTILAVLTNAPRRTIHFSQTNKLISLTFDAVADQRYSLAVDGFSGASGTFTLSLAYVPPPANDDFANRITLTGASISLRTSNLYATKEAGELSHVGQPGARSIWYSWTAPVSGPVAVVGRGDSFYALLDIYTGNSINTITSVPGRFYKANSTNLTSTLTFTATALRSYALAIDGFQGRSGRIDLTLTTQNAPPAIGSFAAPEGPAGNFKLTITGSAGEKFAIQSTTNLTDWSEIFIAPFTTNSFEFSDTNSLKFSHRFYRVLPVP